MAKILLSAYACEPNKGSEPEVGWQWAIHIAQKHEVWILTKENNKETIEEYKRSTSENIPWDNIHFLYVHLPKWSGDFPFVLRTLLYCVFYKL